jgi:DnaJ-domain-containing protein 1
VAELARGTVFDRPWGRTLAALGIRGLNGQLSLVAEGKSYEIAFAHGAVIGASSPIASDAAVRIALTGGLISTTQVAELARKQAAAPDRDEIDLLAEHLKLGADQAMRLRRRTIAQRAARTFSVEKGDFFVTDRVTLPHVPGSELDIRSVIFIGAKHNLSEGRLASELGLFGSWFRVKPEAFDDLAYFGFSDHERPILDRLMNGATLGELEAIEGIDPRSVRAAVYALCAASACNVEQTQSRSPTSTPPLGNPRGTDPGFKRPSQPPAQQATPAREKRPSHQPVVAYRPGRKSPSQPPPVNIELTRPTGATGNTMPPAHARRAGTAPPVGERPGSSSNPGFARPGTGSDPGIPRTATPPTGVARINTPPVGVARIVTPSSGIERISITTPPAVSRTATPTPAVSRTATPMPAVSRTATPMPAVSRTATPMPAVSRTATPTPIPARTVTPKRITTSSTKGPVLQAPDVQALIAARAQLVDAGADHYALLGLAPQATADEIRKAYFNVARVLHPDRLAALGIADEAHIAHRVFAQMNTAFAILADPRRRSEYDAVLARGGEAVDRAEQARADEMATKILMSEEAFKRGELAVKRGDFQLAIAELQKATDMNPEEADFAALHAWALFCAAPDKAAAAKDTRDRLDRAIMKSPKAISPRFLLGRVERMLGRDKEALEIFQEVLRYKPSHFEAQSEVRAIETRMATPPKGGGGLFGRKR